MPVLDIPLRLLFVGTLAEPGGAASHFVSLTRALAMAGHSISVVAAPGSVIWRALEHTAHVTLYGASFTSTFDASAMRVLRQAVDELRPDRVISVFERDYWGTALVAAQLRVPLLLFLHHAGMKRVNRIVLPWMRRRFLLPSESLRNWLVSRGVSACRTSVLYNPVDTCHFRPHPELRKSVRATLGLRDDDVLVGFVGRFESNKGVIPFSNAVNLSMQRVPNLHALWVGFGRREAELDRVIHDSPNAHRHVRLPWVDDPLPYYAAMDFLALPSTGPEAFGRVLVEAQACGIPVLGSHIGGIAETMQPGITGELVPPGDIGAWAQAVTAMALDDERRQHMGTAGRAFARSAFDSQIVVAEFKHLMRSTRRRVALT